MVAKKKPAPKRKPKPSSVGWQPRSRKPKTPGVYRTSRSDITHIGSAYGYWDGQKWTRHEGWGDYSRARNMVWQGLGSKFQTPFRNR